MILILFLSLYCSLHGSNTVEISPQTRAILVSGQNDYFLETAHCIDNHGKALCNTLSTLDAFEAETIRHCQTYMEQAKKQWKSQFPDQEVPFCNDIAAISKIFDECFAGVPFPLWKGLEKGYYLLRVCDHMSFTLDPDQQRQQTFRAEFLISGCAPDSQEDCRKYLSNLRIWMHEDLYQKHSQGMLIPDFIQTHMGGMQIKYQYSITGLFSLLDYIACLKQGVVLLTVQKPQPGSHLTSVHRQRVYGSAELLRHDFAHLCQITLAFRALEEGFERVKPDQANYQVLMNLVCDHLSSLLSDIQKAQSLVVFFCKLHETRIVSDVSFEKCENKIWTLFYLGAQPDQDIFTELVRPLCTKEQAASLQKEDATTKSSAKSIMDANDAFLSKVLESWHERDFFTFSPKLKVFKAKRYAIGDKIDMPWGDITFKDGYVQRNNTESFRAHPPRM